MRLIFSAGWCLSFCDKQPDLRGAKLLTNARRLLGLVLGTVGLVGQFFVI